MTNCETFDHRGLTVRIEYDDNPESPRDWDNLGTMVCWHRRYDLGDGKHDYESPQAFLESLLPEGVKESLDKQFSEATEGLHYQDQMGWQKAEDAHRERVREEADKSHVILPLYLYDHSGITMNTTGFHCPWDSGQVGYIYVSRERAQKECGYAADEFWDKVVEQLRGEVETYDQYLRGDVYGYVVETPEGDHLDSCWGFYGLDGAREEGKSAAEYHANRVQEAEMDAEHD